MGPSSDWGPDRPGAGSLSPAPDRLAGMKAKSPVDRDQLRRLINGYQVTQALHVLAVLAIPDQLAGGPRSSAEVALSVNADEGALYRVLRAVATVGVLKELPERRFALTELGEGLRWGAPGSMAGWAAFVGRPYHQASWARLIDGVRSGENPFQLEFGTDIWTYRREHPEEAVIFNRAMNSLTGSTVEFLVSGYDFSRFHTVVDVGAGGGAMLAGILQRHPGARGVLFDLPHVVADSRTFVDSAGLASRIDLVGGSFLESVPPGGDAYVLKSVLHNWPDGSAARILDNCRTAMHADATLLVVERLVAEPNQGMDVKLMDLNMFVGPGSFERTAEEWQQLLAAAGFGKIRIIPVGGQVVIEATPTKGPSGSHDSGRDAPMTM